MMYISIYVTTTAKNMKHLKNEVTVLKSTNISKVSTYNIHLEEEK